MTALVILGATGDLTARLLFPALCSLAGHGHLDDVRIVGYGLEDWSVDEFTHHVETVLAEVDAHPAGRDQLVGCLSYRHGDLSSESLRVLSPLVEDLTVWYLALPPGLFGTAATAIAEAGLTTGGVHRLVVEKPFGTDQATAGALTDELHAHWPEQQIFRIDHFLGKQTVQNLTVTRFANRVIEPLLCSTHVDQVQITVAETLGIEGRYKYYDGIGALRDMVQNHLLQLFCLAAMEPPVTWNAELLRDHKVEVLRSVRPPSPDISTWAAHGQYASGTVGGVAVPGYLDEPDIPSESTTETFAAIRLHVDNWRWEGTPFYLRTGKRLPTTVAEIAYRFREPPTHLFRHTSLAAAEPNWLVFRLGAPEGIDLFVQTKTPGLDMNAEMNHLHADYGSIDDEPTAYEQLILDVLEGDHTPFIRTDEIDTAWRLLDPVLAAWAMQTPDVYAAGSAGPASQDAILLDGHEWRDLDTRPRAS